MSENRIKLLRLCTVLAFGFSTKSMITDERVEELMNMTPSEVGETIGQEVIKDLDTSNVKTFGDLVDLLIEDLDTL